MTAERLAAWEALCNWFEEQPYNASYYPGAGNCPNVWLLCRSPSGVYPSDSAIRKRYRQIVAERRRIQVIYWRTGKGWQLRRDYREKLDALRIEIAAQPDGPRQLRLAEGKG